MYKGVYDGWMPRPLEGVFSAIDDIPLESTLGTRRHSQEALI